MPEESRRGRAVPVYAALCALGRDGLAEMVERCCRHALRMAELLARHPSLRVLNEVVLNQVLVRVADDDAATREVGGQARVQADGTCWLRWNRLARPRGDADLGLELFRTTTEDVERSAGAILESAAAVCLRRLANRRGRCP